MADFIQRACSPNAPLIQTHYPALPPRSAGLFRGLLVSCLFAFFDDFVFSFARHFFVMTEAFGMNTTSARQRPQGA